MSGIFEIIQTNRKSKKTTLVTFDKVSAAPNTPKQIFAVDFWTLLATKSTLEAPKSAPGWFYLGSPK